MTDSNHLKLKVLDQWVNITFCAVSTRRYHRLGSPCKRLRYSVARGQPGHRHPVVNASDGIHARPVRAYSNPKSSAETVHAILIAELCLDEAQLTPPPACGGRFAGPP